MDARIAAIAGSVFLGVVAAGFLISSADTSIASAIAAPFRDSEDGEDDDDDWYPDDAVTQGVDMASAVASSGYVEDRGESEDEGDDDDREHEDDEEDDD